MTRGLNDYDNKLVASLGPDFTNTMTQKILNGRFRSSQSQIQLPHPYAGSQTFYTTARYSSYLPGSAMAEKMTTSMYPGYRTFTQDKNYDLLERLVSIRESQNASYYGPSLPQDIARASYAYDRAGRRTHATREDGTTWKYTYNKRGEVLSGGKILADGRPVPGHQLGYAYDEIGNRTSASFGAGPQGAGNRIISYTANAKNQYATITHPQRRDLIGKAPEGSAVIVATEADGPQVPGGVQRTGDYYRAELATDAANGEWKNLYIGIDEATADDHQGRKWLPPSTTTLEYDDDGNLTKDDRWHYRWDAHNRLIGMTVTSQAKAAGHPDWELRFTYDHRGRRVRKEVINAADTSQSYDRRFLYDGWNLIAEFEKPAQSAELQLSSFHHWGLDLSNTEQGAGGVGGLIMSAYKNQFGYWQKYRPSYDGNGNIIVWTSNGGQLIEKRDYDPFGNMITQQRLQEAKGFTPSFGFSTKFEDEETGLLYYGYRYLNTETGRWPIRDPIEERGGVNLYGMVGRSGGESSPSDASIGVSQFSRRNQLRCRLAYWRVEMVMRSSHSERESFPSRWASISRTPIAWREVAELAGRFRTSSIAPCSSIKVVRLAMRSANISRGQLRTKPRRFWARSGS